MSTPAKWYQDNPDDKYFYQGDILRDVPYPFWPTLNAAKDKTKWGILRPYKQEGRPIQEVLKQLPTLVTLLIGRAARDIADLWAADGREYVVAGCARTNVMIVTRGCSLDNPTRKHFVVAPVTAIDDLPEEQKSEGKLNDLRKNNIPHCFYLPAVGHLKESYADFLKLAAIHRSFFDPSTIRAQLLARLSSPATSFLQKMLSDHFGTRFGFDHEDECPQTGDYACSNCFHSGMQVKIKKFVEAAPFGPCDLCGEDAMWIKIPS